MRTFPEPSGLSTASWRRSKQPARTSTHNAKVKTQNCLPSLAIVLSFVLCILRVSLILQDGLLHDFFDGREAFENGHQTGLAQGPHAALLGGIAQKVGGGVGHDHVANL